MKTINKSINKETSKFILLGLFPFFFIVLISNFVFTNPTEKDLWKKLLSNYGIRANHEVLNVYEDIIEKKPNSLKNHYWYILALFRNHKNIKSIPKIYNKWKEEQILDNDTLYFALGHIYLNLKDYSKSMEMYKQIINRNVPYVQELLGNIYFGKKEYEKAVEAYSRELDNDGNKCITFRKIYKSYYKIPNFIAISELHKNRVDSRECIPYQIEKLLSIHNGKIGLYVGLLFKPILKNLNSFGFIGAFLILMIWFFFLRNLDIFEKEKIRILLITLFLGMFFTLFCGVLYDIYRFALGFKLNGSIINDALYCVFGIGFIEELVKIVPLFIMIKFTKEVNETIDYIIYAGISAAGFAFMENLMYFDQWALTTIKGRAFTASILHIMMSGIVAYAFVLQKRKKYSNFGITLTTIFTFFAAAFVHGFYDFWLLNKSVASFSFLSFFTLIFMIVVYKKIVINSLNNSEFWLQKHKKIFLNNISYLGAALSLILAFQFMAIAFKFGPYYANKTVSRSIYSDLILVIILVTNLGSFLLEKGKWISLFKKKS